MRTVMRGGVIVLVTILLMVMAIGVRSVFAQEGEAEPAQSEQVDPQPDGRAGLRGLKGDDALLAETLGISPEALAAARMAAAEAAITRALDEGRITQEQADRLLDGQRFRSGHRALRGHAGQESTLLAEALGISEAELDAARSEARAMALANAVAEGRITQEQADLKVAAEALHAYIDRDAILAGVLGITVEELADLKSGRGALREYFEGQGLDRESVRESMQAEVEAAVDQAVEDGVVSREQADQLLSGEGLTGRCGHHRHAPGLRGEEFPGQRFRGPRGGGFQRLPVAPAPANDA